MKKSLLFSIGIIILICPSINILAQKNVDTLPRNPLYSIWKDSSPAQSYDLSFLLQKDSCYDFVVSGKISLRCYLFNHGQRASNMVSENNRKKKVFRFL